jgi:hypothetical protein
MKIRLDVDGEVVTATLEGTAAGRDFAALLPLSLTLTDYADIERIADLPRKLSTAGAPAGMAPKAGDISYYAPWGNLAIFVEDGKGSSRGLVRLGRVDTGLPALRRPGPLKARIEQVEDCSSREVRKVPAIRPQSARENRSRWRQRHRRALPPPNLRNPSVEDPE